MTFGAIMLNSIKSRQRTTGVSPWVKAVAPQVLQLAHEGKTEFSWGIPAPVSRSVDTQISKASIEIRGKDICGKRDRRDQGILP